MSQSSNLDQGSGRPRRLSLYVLLLLLVIGVGGTAYLATRSRTPKPHVALAYAYTAARDLPAFHQIVEEDVRKSLLPRSSLPKAAVTDRDALLGHYTLDPVGQDTPIDASRLGPMLPVGALKSAVVTGLPASSADVMQGGLSRGDEVDVVLSPRVPSRSTGGATLQHVLVVDVRPTSTKPPDYDVIIAMSPKDESQLRMAGGMSQVFFVRVTAYRHP
jgi:Flp pilus assembly protein CpaB